MKGLTIGELARHAEVHTETIRYYERRGLIPAPPRNVSSYRLYPSETLHRVRFIKRTQRLGFSLKDIKQLLALRAAPRARSADIKTCAKEKIEEIERKIRSLQAMREALKRLVAECSGKGPITQCPILHSLESDEIKSVIYP